MLVEAGRAIQDCAAWNPGTSRGLALRGVPLKSGRFDYLPIVDRAGRTGSSKPSAPAPCSSAWWSSRLNGLHLWRQVLEYFDAHLIGLTATPGKQTIGFFNGNLVMKELEADLQSSPNS